MAAGLVASVVGWIGQGLVDPYFGSEAGLLVSLVVSTVAFFVVRRWLIDLRDG